jgi:hypothetical protein
VIARHRDGLARPEPVDDRQTLIEPRGARRQVDRGPEPLELLVAPPEPGAEDHSPAGQPIERRELASDLPRQPAG